jgi:two-component system response regulator ResD
MKETTILIVDDETTIREVVRKYLELEGFRVIEANTGPQALHLLHEEQPDLIVLDIMLPGLDGFTITRSLRDSAGEAGPLTANGRVPIIMLTARSDEADRIMGFELGTDDYVTKPFSPRELTMRVKAVLRRSTPAADSPDQPIVFGDLRLDAATHSVTRGEKNIALTATEFDLLWFLARHPRQVFNREQLLNRVWGYDYYGDDSTVTVHIRRLREKIECDPSQPEVILTVWGVGYKFEPPS